MVTQIRSNHFPTELTENVMVKAVSSETFYKITGQLSDQIFTPFASLGLYTQPKRQKRAVDELSKKIPYEYFVFYSRSSEPVGFSSGRLADGQTFFMEWSGVLPTYQRRGLYSTFLQKLLPYLQEVGIDRVTSNHMGNNRPVLIAKLKAGFNVTGVTLDERYGMLVWLAYFFDEKRQKGFESAFSLDSF